jgi:glyoxylase-like metal-dependent hydrolase (beta-lactamase superfamily II)
MSEPTPDVTGLFDKRTSSVQYIVSDPATKKCAIVDPVLDFDSKSGATATENADKLLAIVAERELTVEWILDTHPHADHFSAARYLKRRTGARTAIGDRIVDVQNLWKAIYNWPEFPADGSQWDKLFAAGETFPLGALTGRVMFSPGHTLASVTYLFGGAAFVHDTLFMPDDGTARTDFPGGSARQLWHSIQAILSLPDETRLFSGHDYQPGGRAPQWQSTVAQQKADNLHLKGRDEEGFVAFREARDRTLPLPKLILDALQININAGALPAPESNGTRYLKIPLNVLGNPPWGEG